MARWRLVNDHYLNVPDTEWEYNETDRNTGRQGRKRFLVPRYLDVDNPGDQTPKGSGEVIVCHEGKGERHDITFSGEPTPEMEPLDDEAEAISAACAHKWKHPIESLPGQGDYSQSIISTFEKMMLTSQVPNMPAKGISLDDFTRLQEQMAELIAQNEELKAEVAEVKVQRRA